MDEGGDASRIYGDIPMSEDDETSRRTFLTALGLTGAYLETINPPTTWPRRQEVLSRVDPVARYFGGYTAYQLNRAEYVGTIASKFDSFDLDHYGYDHNLLSAAKYHPVTAELDDGTWRRIDEENTRWQWHIHIWDRDEGTELFSHYEYRPDPWILDDESASDMRQRLWDHYNPRWDIIHGADEANYFLGAACPKVRALIQDQ